MMILSGGWKGVIETEGYIRSTQKSKSNS